MDDSRRVEPSSGDEEAARAEAARRAEEEQRQAEACTLTGTWEGGNQYGTMTLRLRQDGSDLSGTAGFRDADGESASASVQGSISDRDFSRSDGDDTIRGTLSGDCRPVRITLEAMGESTTLTLTKR